MYLLRDMLAFIKLNMAWSELYSLFIPFFIKSVGFSLFQQKYSFIQQDRRWNADKPSATLDP